MLPAPLLAIAVVLIGSASYDPFILTLTFPDGHEERIAATTPEVCATAVRAIERRLWPKDEPLPATATCQPGNLFSAQSLCIENFNCSPPGARR